MEQSYIYGEREYVMTGREAKKTRASGRIEIKYEIRPVEITDHEDRSYNKWVVMKDLFRVRNEEINDGEDGEEDEVE